MREGPASASTKEGNPAPMAVDRAVPSLHPDAPRNCRQELSEAPCPAEDVRPAEGPSTHGDTTTTPSPVPDRPGIKTPDDYVLALVKYQGEHKYVRSVEMVRDFHRRITDPSSALAKQTHALRSHLGPNGEKTPQFDEGKERLPQVLPAVNAPVYTPVGKDARRVPHRHLRLRHRRRRPGLGRHPEGDPGAAPVAPLRRLRLDGAPPAGPDNHHTGQPRTVPQSRGTPGLPARPVSCEHNKVVNEH